MADDHTREHFLWLRQVAHDPDVMHAAFRLAFVIGEHFNRDSGDAWPSQATLAGRVGVSDRAIRTLTDKLVECGHLEVRAHRGPKAVNVYRAKRKPASGSDHENRKDASSPNTEEPEAECRSSDENRKFSAREPEVFDTRTGSQLPTNYLEQLQNLKRADRHDWFIKNQSSFACYVTNVDDRWQRWCAFLGVKSIWPDKRGGRMFPDYDPPAEI